MSFPEIFISSFKIIMKKIYYQEDIFFVKYNLVT